VFLEALTVFAKARTPGEVFHLPFTWPEEPRKTKWMAVEPAPIIKMHMAEIKKAAKPM
jgi:hypothetical protein